MQPTFERKSFDAISRLGLIVISCAVLGFLSIAACAGLRASTSSSEQAIRGGLNMVAVAVDPAYALAVQGCQNAELSIYNRAAYAGPDATTADGGDILQAARSDIAAVRARCQRVVAAFDEIREWHDLAWAAIEDGKVQSAQTELDRIIEAWRTLQERTSGP